MAAADIIHSTVGGGGAVAGSADGAPPNSMFPDCAADPQPSNPVVWEAAPPGVVASQTTGVDLNPASVDESSQAPGSCSQPADSSCEVEGGDDRGERYPVVKNLGRGAFGQVDLISNGKKSYALKQYHFEDLQVGGGRGREWTRRLSDHSTAETLSVFDRQE